MTQFTVYKNKNPHTHAEAPFLLDIQNDLLSELDTRVVVPLRRATALKGNVLKTLTSLLVIEGESFMMLTPQLAGIPKSELGAPVAQVQQYRPEIIAAIDLLVTGV
jgi:toxin CcdB